MSRSRIQLPQPMPETGAMRREKAKFNMLLRAVEKLIPANAGNEVVEIGALGTKRRTRSTSSISDDAREGRWL